MQIIPAQPKHRQPISKLVSRLDNEHYTFSEPEKVNKYIKKGWYFVAINDEDEVLGAISMRINDGSYELVTLCSDQKGIGSALIDFAVQKCKDENIPKLWCWSLKTYKAKGFYEKMGFDEIYLLKKQWYGQDCYFFGKII